MKKIYLDEKVCHYIVANHISSVFRKQKDTTYYLKCFCHGKEYTIVKSGYLGFLNYVESYIEDLLDSNKNGSVCVDECKRKYFKSLECEDVVDGNTCFDVPYECLEDMVIEVDYDEKKKVHYLQIAYGRNLQVCRVAEHALEKPIYELSEAIYSYFTDDNYATFYTVHEFEEICEKYEKNTPSTT